ncbi:MAG: hypothetical protein AAGJ35_06755, partial [Myxococcota bacterium]
MNKIWHSTKTWMIIVSLYVLACLGAAFLSYWNTGFSLFVSLLWALLFVFTSFFWGFLHIADFSRSRAFQWRQQSRSFQIHWGWFWSLLGVGGGALMLW